MYPNVMPGPSSDALNGLNWQVQVDPLSLSITSLPPTPPPPAGAAVVDDDVDCLEPFDDELPPQAVASMHAATSAASHAAPLTGRILISTPSPRCDGSLSLGNL